MTTFRVVIRVTTTEDFEFKVEANTREEARGLGLRRRGDIYTEHPPIRRTQEERFVSVTAVSAVEIPSNK